MNNNMKKIIGIVVGIIVIIGIVFLVKGIGAKKDEEEAGTVISSEAVSEEVTEEVSIEIPDKDLDWEALKKENEDIYAWIYIPGTKVDYPILQHPTSDEYYLNHNIDGSSGLPGCIYTESLNKKDFSDPNTVLYGHDMKNGSMFATLHNYEDSEFFNNNSYIYVYTPDKTYAYEIFASVTFNDLHLLYQYDFTIEWRFDKFISDVTGIRDMNSHTRADMNVAYGDKLITLSTCIATQPNNRWIVVGVLKN